MSVGYSRPNWARSSIIYLQIDSLQFKKHVPEILVVCVKRSSRATQSGSKCSITGNTTRLCVRRWEIIIVDRQKLTIFQEFSCAPLLQEHLHQRNVLLGTHQATTKVTKKKQLHIPRETTLPCSLQHVHQLLQDMKEHVGGTTCSFQ